ncbi:hypothetical protein JZ751_027334 [Albula glossodonta]|uniref:Uncharacterized protein n=1 Tax=Albula glossodonta TaxID=121402 RepID=A0A8T2NNN1_9TELE|nr:hypothetical protein JZ751_027334 [Albula glossodonta]
MLKECVFDVSIAPQHGPYSCQQDQLSSIGPCLDEEQTQSPHCDDPRPRASLPGTPPSWWFTSTAVRGVISVLPSGVTFSHADMGDVTAKERDKTKGFPSAPGPTSAMLITANRTTNSPSSSLPTSLTNHFMGRRIPQRHCSAVATFNSRRSPRQSGLLCIAGMDSHAKHSDSRLRGHPKSAVAICHMQSSPPLPLGRSSNHASESKACAMATGNMSPCHLFDYGMGSRCCCHVYSALPAHTGAWLEPETRNVWNVTRQQEAASTPPAADLFPLL